MDSWDDDEFEVPSLDTKKVELAAVTWDDEEEEEEEVAPVVQEKKAVDPKTLKPKQLKKLKMKELEEKQKLQTAIARARAAEQAEETDAERRAREQAAIEEADYENAIDAFATDNDKSPSADEDIASAIESMKISTLADHEKIGEIIGNKLASSNGKYILEFLKTAISKASPGMTVDHMKDLTTVINVIKNEKIQAAKPKSKKKQTGKQGYAKVERGGGGFDDYDNFNDYDDFM